MSIYDDFEPWDLDLDGWNGNKPIFDELIAEVRPSMIIEVGAWKGQSTIHMAKAIQSLGLDCHITTVDTWLGALEFVDAGGNRDLMMKNGYPQVYYQFLSNVVRSGVQEFITPLPTTSLIAADWFAKNSTIADLIYIDASHEYRDVLLDLEGYWPLVRDGGLLFGDDYIGSWPGVVDAVDEFFASINVEVKDQDGFWVVHK